MKHLKMLGLAVVAAAALMAFVGAGTASATTLTGVGGSVLGKGTTIHAVNSGTATLTTSFKNIECKESTVQGSTSNETGTTVNGSISSLTFGNCNCEVKVLKNGTLAIENVGNGIAALSSNNAEITASCSSIFGNVHCIYKTSNNSLGALMGGATAFINIAGAKIPRLTTSALCDESANWDATYNVDNPDTLNIIE